MSYILDALKKAEAERQKGSGDGALEPKNSTSETVSEGSRTMIVVAVVAIAALALFWMKPEESSKTVPAVVAPAAPAQAATQSDIRPTSVQPVAVNEPAAAAAPQPTPQPAADPKEKASDIPDIMHMSSTVRSSLPEIKISGHIFDPVPANRMVIINDKVLREGKYLNSDLMVEEITEKGLVLDYAGNLFFMTPFDSWPR